MRNADGTDEHGDTPLLRAVRYLYEAESAELDRIEAARAAEDTHGAPVRDIRARLHEHGSVARVADGLIDEAMARGDFDNLAYAGKPLPGGGAAHDPDWWLKGLIQREHLSGIGPEALLLRRLDAGFDDELATLPDERSVRAAVAEFNYRVVHARMQLRGGPPVVTATRDADAQVARWRERRAGQRPAREPMPDGGAVGSGAVPDRAPGGHRIRARWLRRLLYGENA
ncbi:DUF1992 domain-containing protein [Specibacter cremeus]|uniref:DnaJ family domain-containing protein n=1 Tax=Specibacter cremeus TaxID=1629051 RepID=UPI001F0BCF0A|nr:DUF1992 domain-containing protein [Specibacter cremeus]